MKKFFFKHRALIGGIVAALIITLREFNSSAIDWTAVGFACVLAVLGVIGNYLKGQATTLGGIFGTFVLALTEMLRTGSFDQDSLFYLSAIALLTTIAPTVVPQKKEEAGKPPYPYNTGG